MQGLLYLSTQIRFLIDGERVTCRGSKLRVLSFGVIRVRISDPRSVWIMVHQRNRQIRDLDSPVPLMPHDPDISWISDPNSDHPKGTHSPVLLMYHDPDRSWITDPNSDHPKGTHPNYFPRTNKTHKLSSETTT